MYALWKPVRWVFGYAQYEVVGDAGEAFLSHCLFGAADIWKIRRVRPGVLRFQAPLSRHEALTDAAERFGVSLTCFGRRGLLPLLKRYRMRPGLFIGLFLYVVLMLLLPHFVWSVEVPGVDPIRARSVRNTLLEHGFGVGSFVPSLDLDALRADLMLALDGLSYAAVNVEGCRGIVNVRFAQDDIPNESNVPCNLVASREGQILSVLVRRGVRCVQKGQYVQKGDLLVGGICETRLGFYTVHANATVLARVADCVSQTVAYRRVTYKRTGQSCVRRTWSVFGNEIDPDPDFTCPYESYDVRTERTCLSFGDNSDVPIVRIETVYYQTAPVCETLTREQAEALANRMLDESDRLRLCTAQVESRRDTVTADGNGVTVTRNRTLIVDICEEKEFYFEDKGP